MRCSAVQAPSGPISFEALYAKLLVYCHDVNLPPSTEGAPVRLSLLVIKCPVA